MSDAARSKEPAWEVARLFPWQGQWRESDYLDLTERTRFLVELSDGHVEVLCMPKTSHLRIVAFLYRALLSHIEPGKLGLVLFAPLRLRLWEGKFREPDLVFALREHREWIGEDYWTGADLVVEVVSEDDPDRDLVTKREEYARAAIGEYWIVDPRLGKVTVLTLGGDDYQVHADARAGAVSSRILGGFEVDVQAIFDSAHAE